MVVASPPKPAKKVKKRAALPAGMEQPTLDGLFAIIPEAPEPETPPAPIVRAQPDYEPLPGKPKQLGFDSLEELLSGDVGAIPREIPAGGTGSGWGGVSR